MLKLCEEIKKYVLLFIFLISAYIILLTISCALPSDSIRDNIDKKRGEYYQEGVYASSILHTTAAMLDNFTDALMLNTAYWIDNEHPFQSWVEAKRWAKGDNPFEDLYIMPKNVQDIQGHEMVSYARYWHGYLVFLRPLLLVISYFEIRFFNILLIWSLVISISIGMYLRYGKIATVAFVVGMLAIQISFVPYSMQFMSVVLLSLIAMQWFMVKKNSTLHYLLPMFFIIGSLTSFLDLLTAPFITLGLPLIVLILENKNKINAISLKENFIYYLSISGLWLLGYSATWSVKWLLALMMNVDLFLATQVQYRLGLTGDSNNYMVALGANFSRVKVFFVLIAIFMIYLICKKVYVFFKKRKNFQIDGSLGIYKAILLTRISNYECLLLFVALLPYVWYCVLVNHSSIHYWFTYRAQAVTVTGLILFLESILGDKD